MFNLDIIYTQPATYIDPNQNFRELNRLLSAAIVSTGFRNLLITNPESAVANGYQGEKFNLTRDEYSWLISVQATDLASFASQLLDFQNTRVSDRDMAIPVKIPAMSPSIKVL
jgi:hypothetical protein